MRRLGVVLIVVLAVVAIVVGIGWLLAPTAATERPAASSSGGIIGFEALPPRPTVEDGGAQAPAIAYRAVLAEGPAVLPTGELRLRVPGGVSRLFIDGVPIELEPSLDAPERLLAFELPPGEHRVLGEHLGDDWVVPVQTLAAAEDAAEEHRIVPSASLTLIARVRADVDAWLEGCVAATSMRPKGCPFSYWDESPKSVTWSLSTAPSYRVEYGDAATAVLRRVDSGRALVRYQQGGKRREFETRFEIYGSVALDQDRLIPLHYAG